MTNALPPRPTPEHCDRWPSCQIIAVLHDIEAALAASTSTMASIQLRQAITITRRALAAQSEAEAEDGRDLDLTDEADSERTKTFSDSNLAPNYRIHILNTQ